MYIQLSQSRIIKVFSLFFIVTSPLRKLKYLLSTHPTSIFMKMNLSSLISLSDTTTHIAITSLASWAWDCTIHRHKLSPYGSSSSLSCCLNLLPIQWSQLDKPCLLLDLLLVLLCQIILLDAQFNLSFVLKEKQPFKMAVNKRSDPYATGQEK